ncbi:hypothetical protein HN748_01315 [Candidatus Peregrinibacteria bacterium]|jgi:hypothetical protein|nr:hypothetical protein [Candidatus Peregrinibacteria bacterium]MBT7702850.1 hypothetical protein [Candidatus Peregrinibacteria bacterium]
MIDYPNLTASRPSINYDTTALTIQGYELKFALDFENPTLQEVIEKCEKHNWPYKILDGDGRQKHIWIKGWIRE